MGDHRFTFDATIEMHGIKEKIGPCWLNWDDGPGGIDSRIRKWIEDFSSRAFAKFYDEVEQRNFETRSAEVEKEERETYERLKAKFE